MFKRDRARLDLLEKRLGELVESHHAIQRQLEGIPSTLAAMRSDIDLQWEKIQRALGRLAKRDATEANADRAGDGESSEEQITQMILEGFNPWPTR